MECATPPQTGCKSVFRGGCFASLSLELQTDIEHRVDGARDIAAPLALDIALKLTCEGGMDDAVARDVG